MRGRHSLAWLSAAGWREAIEAATPECRDAIRSWQLADWPATVRRQDAGARMDECSLGIALPPDVDSGVKKRIGLRVSTMHLTHTSAPLALSEAIPKALPVWKEALTDLDQKASAAGLVLRVYGSLALQAMTEKDYLKPGSDIDLLLAPVSREQLLAGVDLLQEAGEILPLDGEIAFPGGQGVAWKEWHAAAAGQRGTRVLVKHLYGVRLATPSELLAALDGREWTA
ncbi:malonate decarboxylase holo-[acyl-carrier-protein] synthase [Herbaspirillum sp. GCM10030257]|uniref:malonate decarboxylase holo-[acyl-carrier-protein] synthase n=1 Tax=Herbaspirillum sp. GCM10030257 TaxID=3273393 RepID=UPI00361353C9